MRSSINITLGNGNHQPEISFDEFLPSFFIPPFNPFSEFPLLFSSQKIGLAYFFKVSLHRIRQITSIPKAVPTFFFFDFRTFFRNRWADFLGFFLSFFRIRYKYNLKSKLKVANYFPTLALP